MFRKCEDFICRANVRCGCEWNCTIGAKCWESFWVFDEGFLIFCFSLLIVIFLLVFFVIFILWGNYYYFMEKLLSFWLVFPLFFLGQGEH